MRFFRRFLRAAQPAVQPHVPEGQRVYAIGDVHGRLDLLTDLIDRIAGDDTRRGPAQTHIVLLGDLIDRGRRSAQVIDYLLNARPGFAQFHFLMGNHEEAMLASLEYLADPRETGWLSFGGLETLESYEVPDYIVSIRGALLSEEIRPYIPIEHRTFIASFLNTIRFGDYLFVHAGIRPGTRIEEQDPHDLRWIRGEFLSDDSDHGAVIVHGHSIGEMAEFRFNRIGVDTGAYRTGILTALGLEGTDQWTLATGAGGNRNP